MSDFLVRRFGWTALFLHGDPLVLDRFLWLRRRLASHGAPEGMPTLTLDAGCGNGGFAIYAARRGHIVLGISDTQAELGDARRRAQLLGVNNVEFQQLDLRRLDVLNNGEALYDNVICLEVVEHILDDVGLLKSIGRRTRAGGRLFLSTPTAEHSPQFREMQHQTDVEDGRHVRFGYSMDRLQKIIEDAGFAVDEVQGVGGILMQRLTNLMRRIGQYDRRLAWAVTFPLRILRLFDPAVTRVTGSSHLSYGVVATRLPERAAPGSEPPRGGVPPPAAPRLA